MSDLRQHLKEQKMIDLTGVTTTGATRNVVALLTKAGLNPHFGPDGAKPYRGAVEIIFDEGGVDGLFGVVLIGARSGKILRASLYFGNNDRHGQRHVGYLPVREAFAAVLKTRNRARCAIEESEVTYQAAFTPGDREVTVVRNIHAGVSGPDGSYSANSLTAAAQVLFDAGYLVASPWRKTGTGDLWCALTPMV